MLTATPRRQTILRIAKCNKTNLARMARQRMNRNTPAVITSTTVLGALLSAGALAGLCIFLFDGKWLDRPTEISLSAALEAAPDARLTVVGKVRAFRSRRGDPYIESRIDDPALTPESGIELELPASGGKLEFDFRTSGASYFLASVPELVWSFDGFKVPTRYAGFEFGCATLRLPPDVTKVRLTQLDHPGLVQLWNLTFTVEEVEQFEGCWRRFADRRSPAHYVLITLVAALAAGFLLSFWQIRHRDCFWVGTILLCGFLLTLYFGMPFASNAGSIDICDDTDYWHWAHGLAYRGSLDQTVANPHGQNKAMWGTGLIFAVPLLLSRLIHPASSGFQSYNFVFVTGTSICLTIVSIVLYYAAFRRFTKNWAAFLAAMLTLLGTSMIKWTYVRNIFSHSPEAFALSLFTLMCVLIYGPAGNRRPWRLLVLAATGILLVQVRLENAALALAPAYLEALADAPPGRKARRIAFCLCFVLAAAALAAWVNHAAAGLPSSFSEGQLFDPGRISLHTLRAVLVGKAGLLTMTVFPLVALIGYWRHRPRTRYWLAGAVLVLAYVVMCAAHQYPTGCEWQNRFLLKLNPLIFLGVALFLDRFRHLWSRVVGVLVVVVGAVYQVGRFFANIRQIDPELQFYPDLLTDFQIFRPLATDYLVFFVPLFSTYLLAALGIVALWIVLLRLTRAPAP